MLVETHPFGVFVPPRARYLLLGSFTARLTGDPAYDWFYGSRRNQFWPILEAVYDKRLANKKDKQKLFRKLGMAMADIIYRCERKTGSNLDANLINIVYNIEAIGQILRTGGIEKIFFFSRFVETRFKRYFKNIIGGHKTIEFVTLPSPSPRYAAMSKSEKVVRYKDLLPTLQR